VHFYILTINNLKQKKIIPSKTASKRIKDLRMNLTKKMKEVCTEKDKMVLKETKEDMNNKKKKERYSMLGETPGKRNLTGYTVHSITKNQLSN